MPQRIKTLARGRTCAAKNYYYSVYCVNNLSASFKVCIYFLKVNIFYIRIQKWEQMWFVIFGKIKCLYCFHSICRCLFLFYLYPPPTGELSACVLGDFRLRCGRSEKALGRVYKTIDWRPVQTHTWKQAFQSIRQFSKRVSSATYYTRQGHCLNPSFFFIVLYVFIQVICSSKPYKISIAPLKSKNGWNGRGGTYHWLHVIQCDGFSQHHLIKRSDEETCKTKHTNSIISVPEGRF